jgi:arylsulfatase A-like enzyme/acetyl esterase/lipase
MKRFYYWACVSVFTLTAFFGANGATNEPPSGPPAGKAKRKAARVDEAITPTRRVVYKTVGDRKLELHLFEPAGHKATDRRTCFVAIHGGGWVGGQPSRFYRFAAHFAKLGCVGVSVQYRLLNKTDNTTVFDCVKDGRSAVRYLRQHAEELGIDPQKIVVSGGSAGGHVAAATALFEGIDEPGEDVKISCVPNALVLYFPVIDTSTEGYGNAKCGEHWQELSPLHRVKAGAPPTLILHGTADTTTPFKGAKAFVEAMHQAGNRCDLIAHEGGKHGYFMANPVWFNEAMQQTEDFLKSLKLLDTAAIQPAKPNIFFVFADQLRASATGYGGDPNVRTPNLDTLARQGLNFRNAVSVCPVCTPYRAALITGRFPTTTGMFLNDAYLPDGELSIAEVLKPAGYDTGYIGKWHLDGHGRLNYIPPERRQGFDYWKVAECDHNYNHSLYYTGNSSEKRFWDGYDAVAQTRDAQQYLRDHAHTGKPFCLFLSYGIPHFPHGSAPEQFKALYPPDKIKFSPNVPPEMQTQKVRTEAQGYYAHIRALDQCIGDLTKTLAEVGLDKNTILVFTSDHGEMMGSQGIRPYTKQVVYNEAAHVPFLLRYPKAHGATGHPVLTPLTTPDIMPTLLGLAGVPIPATVEGKDLSALVSLDDKELPDHDALYMGVAPFAGDGNNTPYRAIRTSRYTYVRRLEGPWLLFDDQNDPYQTNNLVNQSALAHELNQRLQAALQGAHDDFRPPAYYVEKFGYELAPHGSISYGLGARVQSPRPLATGTQDEAAGRAPDTGR